MTKYGVLSIKGVYNGVVSNVLWGESVHSYTVTVKNTESGHYTRFNYYMGLGLKSDNYNDLGAFYSFITDGLSVLETRDFFDFCDNFGYNYDRTARTIYKKCENALNRLTRVTGLTHNELYDYVNKFVEDNPDVV